MPQQNDNKAKKNTNIAAAAPASLIWNSADVPASLENLLSYVETEAKKSIDWYFRNKVWKSRLSRFIQFSAVALTAAGGILPIVGQLSKNDVLSSGLWATLFVGLAAALLALDKTFGFSSGWARYILTATNIRRALEEFRLDWASLIHKAGATPSPEHLESMIQRAKEFRVTVEALVLLETRDWITEFQNNIAQLEKDVNAQLDTLKTQTEKAIQAEKMAREPGAIQLTIANVDQAAGAEIRIKLEGPDGTSTSKLDAGANGWVRRNVTPGQYCITASAMVGNKPASAVAVVIVKPGEVAQPELALPS